MIVGALCAEGGERWLRKQMNANPVAFMGLVAKILRYRSKVTATTRSP
jgi:hypothetical protein